MKSSKKRKFMHGKIRSKTDIWLWVDEMAWSPAVGQDIDWSIKNLQFAFFYTGCSSGKTQVVSTMEPAE